MASKKKDPLSLKFIVDVGVGKKIVDFLRIQGFDVLSVLDIDPSMKDIEILRIANDELRLIITMDKDFGELVFQSKKSHSGVLILRLEHAKSDEKIAVINEIINKYSEEIISKFSVYANGKLRIKKD